MICRYFEITYDIVSTLIFYFCQEKKIIKKNIIEDINKKLHILFDKDVKFKSVNMTYIQT